MTSKQPVIDVPALIVPGIGNSGPQHWQTIWQARHPHWKRVAQRDWNRPDRQEWVLVLDAAVRAFSTPPVLIAHSLGALVVAHWAAGGSLPVRAAFLVAVPDPGGANFPAMARGFQPVPSRLFPFPSLVIASTDDPFGSVAYARRHAGEWGSEFVEIGAAGHINVESGHGEWPEGLDLLWRLLSQRRESAGMDGMPPVTRLQ